MGSVVLLAWTSLSIMGAGFKSGVAITISVGYRLRPWFSPGLFQEDESGCPPCSGLVQLCAGGLYWSKTWVVGADGAPGGVGPPVCGP